jgi:hypothetical protein
MKAKTIAVMESTGRVLCCTIFRTGGKKLLAKGHVISEEDARMLETEGMNRSGSPSWKKVKLARMTLSCRSRAKLDVERSKSVLPLVEGQLVYH